jgi:response regulator RpfG family c-di-GMP phosphodiesterase
MNKRILIVDDEESVLNTLKRLFRNKPYDIYTATGGEEGLALLEQHSVELIISDMRMPIMDGAEFLCLAKQKCPMTERILLTGFSDMESTIKAINDAGIFGYLSKPWDVAQLLSLVESALQQTHKNKLKNRTLKHFKQQNDELEDSVVRSQREMEQSADFVSHAFQKLEDSQGVTEQILLNLLDLKLKGQRAYAEEVASFAKQFSNVLGFNENDAKTLELAARLHGIGKIGVPDDVLSQTLDGLSCDDFELYCQYPANSACTLMAYQSFQDVAQVVFEQKEYIDGTGFPNALKGDEISFLSKCLALLLDYAELRFGISTGTFLAHEQVMSVIHENLSRYDASLIPALSSLTLDVEAADESTEMMLPFFSLREGLMLTQDIYSENEILLLPKETILSEKMITNLLNIERNNKKPLFAKVRFVES